MTLGKFIAFEGADGAGTTTQSKLLVKALCKALGSDKVLHTFEPSNGVIGKTLRKILSGTEGALGDVWGWRELSYMFMADRIHHVKAEVIPALKSGMHVVCDRYYASTLVYQSIGASSSWSRTKRMFNLLDEVTSQENYIEPDMWFYLMVSDPEILWARRSSRNALEIYDQNEIQQKVIEMYEYWYGLTKSIRRVSEIGAVYRIDGTLEKIEVFQKCLGTVLSAYFPEHLSDLDSLVKSSLEHTG
jgi:dTMP kinase